MKLNNKGYSAGLNSILAHIDRELGALRQARELLAAEKETESKARPKPHHKLKSKAKHNVTPEGRQRIAEAVKRRWAKHKTKTSR